MRAPRYDLVKEMHHQSKGYLGNHWYLSKWTQTLLAHNLFNKGPISTILALIESPDQWLQIGTKMVEIGLLLTKLRNNTVDVHFNKYQGNLLTGDAYL